MHGFLFWELCFILASSSQDIGAICSALDFSGGLYFVPARDFVHYCKTNQKYNIERNELTVVRPFRSLNVDWRERRHGGLPNHSRQSSVSGEDRANLLFMPKRKEITPFLSFSFLHPCCSPTLVGNERFLSDR
jgi:hypothetical protein